MRQPWFGIGPQCERSCRDRRPRLVEALEPRPLLSALHAGFPAYAPKTAGEVSLAYLHTPIPEGAPLVEHIHPHLTILIGGRAQVIPALIGHVPFIGWMPVHTHTPDGTIHVESTVNDTYRLKDVFSVWGKVFNPYDVLGHLAGHGHTVTMTVDGRPSQEFENLILKDQQQIVIRYQ